MKRQKGGGSDVVYAKSKRERNGHQSSRRGWASGVGLDELAGEAAS